MGWPMAFGTLQAKLIQKTNLLLPSKMTDTLPRVPRSISGGCDFVRYHWVFTEADQQIVDAHWKPEFYRHSIINSMVYLASLPGAGIPGWGGNFSEQVAAGRVQPTGLEDDPRVPVPQTGGGDILSLLRDAAKRASVEIAAEHAAMLAEHAALKASWAGRARARPTPTLEDARKRRAERLAPPRSDWMRTVPGVWRPWEIEEIMKEQARAARIERAWARAEASYKAINPTWGGGT